MMKSFLLVIAICPHNDHMVGILPGEWRWCTLCMNESDDQVNNICKVLRDSFFVLSAIQIQIIIIITYDFKLSITFLMLKTFQEFFLPGTHFRHLGREWQMHVHVLLLNNSVILGKEQTYNSIIITLNNENLPL